MAQEDGVTFGATSDDSVAGAIKSLHGLAGVVPGITDCSTTVAVIFDQLSRSESRALAGAFAAHGGKRLSPHSISKPITFPSDTAHEIMDRIEEGKIARFYNVPGLMPVELAGKTEIAAVATQRPSYVCIYTKAKLSSGVA